MQKDKTDKSLVIDIQFFLKFGFVLLEGNKYCYTHTHTHTHTHTKQNPESPQEDRMEFIKHLQKQTNCCQGGTKNYAHHTWLL